MRYLLIAILLTGCAEGSGKKWLRAVGCGLSECASYEINPEHDQYCRNLGLEKGTEGYADCMLRLRKSSTNCVKTSDGYKCTTL